MSYDEAKEMADHYNIRYLETSAKESINVDKAFSVMTKEIKDKVATLNQHKTIQGPVRTINPKVLKVKNRCC